MRWVTLPLLVVLLGCPVVEPCEGDCLEIPEGETLRIGTALVMTGELGDVGEQGARAVELAVEQHGTLAGFDLEVVSEDSACTGAGGLSALEVLVSRWRLVGVVGPSCSVAAEAILAAGAPARPLVSPSNTSPLLTRPERHQPGYFRVAPSDGQQAARMAEHAVENLGVERAVLITDGSDVMAEIGSRFEAALVQAGGLQTGELVLGDDLEELAVVMVPATNLAQLVYLALPAWQAAQAADWIRQHPQYDHMQLAGLDLLDDPVFLEAPGSEGALLTRFAWYHTGAGYESFVAAWEERWDDSPTALFHAHAWDAAQLLLAGLEEAARPASGGALHVDLDALTGALHAVDTLPALTGVLGCDASGDCAAPTPIDLRIVVDGGTEPAPVP